MTNTSTSTASSRTVEAQIIDPCSCGGFDYIAAAFGVESAYKARIAALKQRLEGARFMRWHVVNPRRDLVSAQFDFAWHLACGDPSQCREIVADLISGAA